MAWDPVFQFSVTWDNISNKPASFPGMWDAPNDANYYVRSGGEWEAIDVPAIIENYLVWGNIGGSLINQSDLWNTMVRTSGNQEAAGTKTWTGPAVFTKTANADSLVVERTGGTARNAHIHYKTDSQSIYAGIGNVSDSIFCIGTDINLLSANSPFQFNLANGVFYSSGEMRGGSARFDGITTIRAASNANRRLVFLESNNDLAAEIVGTSAGGMWIGGPGNIVIRPNGTGSSSGQTIFSPNGDISASGDIYSGSNIVWHDGLISRENPAFGSTSDATSSTKMITISSNGYAGLFVNGDAGNTSGEPGGSFVSLGIDGGSYNSGTTKTFLSAINSAGDDGMGGTWTGTTANSGLIAIRGNYRLQFGSNGVIAFHIQGSHATFNGNISSSGVISDSIGNVRKPEFRTANGTITLNSNDVNRIVEKSNNSSYTYTIPSGHGSHGDIITFVNSGTSGNLTINRASGVSLYRNGTNANISVGPGSTVTVYRSATSNRWVA